MEKKDSWKNRLYDFFMKPSRHNPNVDPTARYTHRSQMCESANVCSSYIGRWDSAKRSSYTYKLNSCMRHFIKQPGH